MLSEETVRVKTWIAKWNKDRGVSWSLSCLIYELMGVLTEIKAQLMPRYMNVILLESERIFVVTLFAENTLLCDEEERQKAVDSFSSSCGRRYLTINGRRKREEGSKITPCIISWENEELELV